jgi:hypothetical protein
MTARELLAEVLAHGPAPVEAVKRRAASEGITERALGRARERAGIRSFARDGRRYWVLPYVRVADRPVPRPEQTSLMVDMEEGR